MDWELLVEERVSTSTARATLFIRLSHPRLRLLRLHKVAQVAGPQAAAAMHMHREGQVGLAVHPQRAHLGETLAVMHIMDLLCRQRLCQVWTRQSSDHHRLR